MNTESVGSNESEQAATEGPSSNAGKPEGRKITTAHIYLNQWFKRLNHGKVYKKTVSSILASAPLPEETAEAIQAAADLLKAANESAPNASPQTRKMWLRQMSARLHGLGHVVPK